MVEYDVRISIVPVVFKGPLYVVEGRIVTTVPLFSLIALLVPLFVTFVTTSSAPASSAPTPSSLPSSIKTGESLLLSTPDVVG